MFGQNQDFAVSIEYQSYSENDFDQKLGILTKLTKKFLNFENFKNFKKMRQSLARKMIIVGYIFVDKWNFSWARSLSDTVSRFHWTFLSATVLPLIAISYDS